MSEKPASTYDVDILRRIEDTTLNDQELARNAQILEDYRPEDSEIRQFYKNKCVFITGVTGFVGKVLLEKLLRSCPEISTVFLLIRPKKGKTAEERINDFLEQSIFDRLRKEYPNFRKKIVIYEGDLQEMNLGMSEAHRQNLQQSVSVIFHGAATVRFDEPLKKAVRINIRGTSELFALALGCQKLESVVYISTAYSHCNRKEIDEKFYPPPMKAVDAINLVENYDDASLEKMGPDLMGSFPNTYIFTKAITEDMIKDVGKVIPISIVRPSIIVATYREPVRGWADNIYGPTGVLVGAGLGLIHTFFCDGDKVADLVPVDMVVNNIIAAGWQTALDGRQEEPKVYNYVCGPQKPITWSEFKDYNREHGINTPSMHAVWYYSLFYTKSPQLHVLFTLLLHYLPAFVLDTIARLQGKEPKMIKMYQKIRVLNNCLAPFVTNEWKWTNTNVQNLYEKLKPADKHVFHFDLSKLDWIRHAETYLVGLRVYFLKDPTTTLPEARIKWKRLKYLHYGTIYFFMALPILILAYLLLSIFN